MKKNLYLLMALLFSCTLFLNCSDDKKGEEEEEEEEEEEVIKVNASYGGKSGNTLKLTYSEEPLLGKEVEFYTADKKKAKITLNYVIPGEATTELTDVALTTDDDSDYEYEFEGTLKTETKWNLTYTGSVKDGEIVLDLEATVPIQNTLIGTWTPDVNTPVYINWQSGKEITLGTFVNEQLNISAPITVNTQALNDMLEEFEVGTLLKSALRNVTFHEDGNITAEYAKAGSWQKSPVNLVHYYLSGDDQIKVILNHTLLLTMIDLSDILGGGSGVSIDIEKLPTLLSDLLTDGLSIGCKPGTSLQIYLEQELLESLFDKGNEELVSLLNTLEFEFHHPMNLPMHGRIPGEVKVTIAEIMEQLPEILEDTFLFEAGIIWN